MFADALVTHERYRSNRTLRYLEKAASGARWYLYKDRFEDGSSSFVCFVPLWQEGPRSWSYIYINTCVLAKLWGELNL